MTTVERCWPGETFCCIASGPSLTSDDVALVRGRARVIVVNTSYQLAPWADVLYACDADWWRSNTAAQRFQGLKFGLHRPGYRFPTYVSQLRNTGAEGLELSPNGLRHGKNSGYQAINLAVHLGASRILLLGYDMQRGPKGEEHWHKPHPTNRLIPYGLFLKHYRTIVDPLRELGIPVVNCTRQTALESFPRQSLEDALGLQREAVA